MVLIKRNNPNIVSFLGHSGSEFPIIKVVFFSVLIIHQVQVMGIWVSLKIQYTQIKVKILKKKTHYNIKNTFIVVSKIPKKCCCFFVVFFFKYFTQIKVFFFYILTFILASLIPR